MLRKTSEAIQLLVGNFPLLALVILTVWLPGNLLVNYLVFYVFDPDDVFRAARVGMWIEGIFGPIYLGAMIHALWQIKQGRPVGYGEAIGVGLRNWGRLFAARFVAGLLILLGLLLLIVPGVVLALRYAFVDCAVIIEEANTKEALRRSTDLTAGIKLRLLALAVSLFLGFILVSAAIYFPITLLEELGQLSVPAAMAAEFTADCVLDIVYAVLQIAIFLYYWEKREVEWAAERPPVPNLVGKGDSMVAPPFGTPQDDDNPYRSPRT